MTDISLGLLFGLILFEMQRHVHAQVLDTPNSFLPSKRLLAVVDVRLVGA